MNMDREMIIAAIGAGGTILAGICKLCSAIAQRQKTIVHRRESGPAAPGAGTCLWLIFRNTVAGALLGALLGLALAGKAAHPEPFLFGYGMLGLGVGFISGMFVKPSKP
jgi:hypothetical protein